MLQVLLERAQQQAVAMLCDMPDAEDGEVSMHAPTLDDRTVPDGTMDYALLHEHLRDGMAGDDMLHGLLGDGHIPLDARAGTQAAGTSQQEGLLPRNVFAAAGAEEDGQETTLLHDGEAAAPRRLGRWLSGCSGDFWGGAALHRSATHDAEDEAWLCGTVVVVEKEEEHHHRRSHSLENNDDDAKIQVAPCDGDDESALQPASLEGDVPLRDHVNARADCWETRDDFDEVGLLSRLYSCSYNHARESAMTSCDS